MEQSVINITKLVASPGKYITKKYVDKEEERTFSIEIYLSINDKVDDYMEVDSSKKDEHDKYMAEKYPSECAVSTDGNAGTDTI